MSQIDVIMFATTNLKTYTALSIKVWQKYCKTHGYSFVHYENPYYEDLHLAWSKIRSVREHLLVSKADYVVLVDADTIPTSFQLSIDQVIKEFMTEGKEILFQKDGSNRLKYLYFPHNLSIAWDKKLWVMPNAGFIIMKNNPTVLAFFDEWLERALTSPLAKQAPRNQRVLIYEMLNQKAINDMVGYVETWVINKFKGKLAIHFSSKSPEEVRRKMWPIYQRLMGNT